MLTSACSSGIRLLSLLVSSDKQNLHPTRTLATVPLRAVGMLPNLPNVDVSIGPEGPPPALALLVLFGRCLVAGAIVSSAAWMLFTALMDQFA